MTMKSLQISDEPNLCLNFQFPNGAKSIQAVKEDISRKLNIRPFCYVVSLLYYAQQQPSKELLTKQEVGYYVLNNLDVLQGGVTPAEVYSRIMEDRKAGVKRERLSGSYDWQHIREQFNLLELANLIETDATYLWLNKDETGAVSVFLDTPLTIGFDCYRYKLDNADDNKIFLNEWRKYYGRFNTKLSFLKTIFRRKVKLVDKNDLRKEGGAVMSNTDLGDEGEALVFRIERERVKRYKERLVNKVLLLGKTKGLGYDIASVEADENPYKPEFARYIEVKSTRRVTAPSFDKNWSDTLNITAKEWVAAEQYGSYYYIYRVYFTKNKTIVVKIKDPYRKNQDGNLEVFPTIYQMNFGSSVIEILYDE